MTKNPFINALSALLYIAIVAVVMFYGTKSLPKEDTVFTPIVILSLFTLSAAMMGYLFLFQPLQLYLDGKKKVAVNLFLQTFATFAVITAVILLLVFTGILH
jgi:hypothetical protein